jgi:hypothetical protein
MVAHASAGQQRRGCSSFRAAFFEVRRLGARGDGRNVRRSDHVTLAARCWWGGPLKRNSGSAVLGAVWQLVAAAFRHCRELQAPPRPVDPPTTITITTHVCPQLPTRASIRASYLALFSAVPSSPISTPIIRDNVWRRSTSVQHHAPPTSRSLTPMANAGPGGRLPDTAVLGHHEGQAQGRRDRTQSAQEKE